MRSECVDRIGAQALGFAMTYTFQNVSFVDMHGSATFAILKLARSDSSKAFDWWRHLQELVQSSREPSRAISLTCCSPKSGRG